jgi:hypothetical protein
MSRRVAVIGLNCADPKLVFDRWLDDIVIYDVAATTLRVLAFRRPR